MKRFTSTNDGEFNCTLVTSRGRTKILSFHGIKEHEHVTIPPCMTAEAGRLHRRGDGDGLLELAERAITLEVGG